MQTKTFYASCMKQDEPVALGRQMEDNYRAITFDLSGFGLEIDRAMIVHQRKADAAPYVVTSVTGGDSITWTVTNTDTAYSGRGEAEIRIEFTNGLAKSVVFQTVVIRSITADTEIPAALQSWYDAMIDYIDDHSVSPEQIEQAVADYLDEHPVQAPVTSVNSKIGVVVLNADDVGALPDTTTAADLGAYVKPNTGVPKTDLSAAVQASLDKADSALQTAPVTSVNSKTGDVVLDASDVGAYEKPNTGIPKTDLASDVQASLNRADTALQSAPVTSVNSKVGAVTITAQELGALTAESDPVFSASPAAGITSQDITSWDNKSDFSGSYTDLTNKPSIPAAGLPAGGSTGQVLSKSSNADYAVQWTTVSGGGAVDSVNGQTGAVVLDASDVGALPDTTTAADLGAYVKPSTGIPKTDLASDVQTSLGKADTALQTAPVTSVNGATGAVVIANATTSAAGLMSATDKSHLDAVYADYSSALTALGVI